MIASSASQDVKIINSRKSPRKRRVIMTDEVQEGVTQDQVAADQQIQQQQLTDKEINFQALRQKAEALERQNQMLQAKIYEEERQRSQQQPQPQYRDDDIPTWGDVQKLRQQDMQEMGQLKEMLADISMRTKYQDYDSTVKEYLPDVLKEDPDLALAIRDNPMMNKLAYKLAQASPRYHEKRLAAKNEAAVDRIVQNASRAQPAPAKKNIMVQDEDAKLATMSEKDIMDMFNMAKARY